MIVEKTMYTIKCNSCGQEFQDEHHGFVAWTDEKSVYLQAQEVGWLIGCEPGEDKDYCDKCHEWDDNDNIVIKPIKLDSIDTLYP